MAAATLFTACTDVIDLDLDETERALTVDGRVLTSDSVQWVRLSYTRDYFATGSPDYMAEQNALVLFFENSVLVDTMDFNVQTMRFEIIHEAQVGNSYHIELTTSEGISFFSEEELIRPVLPIDTLFYLFTEDGFSGDEVYEIYLESQEAPGIGDHYQWRMYINNDYLSEPQDMVYASDEFVDGNYISDFDIFDMELDVYERYLARDGRVVFRVDQMGISKSYFEFLQGVQEQTAFAGGPFSSPAAEVLGNVFRSDGSRIRALGYFYAASVETNSVELPN